jgi:branched-chain amino acid transport system ATP-binding protein
MLEVRDLAVSYGAVAAVRGVSFEVAAGEIVAIVGPNGAGKTSLVNAIAGAAPPAGGRVVFAGRAIQGWPSERIARSGLALVPEGRGIFATLTVAENLRLGALLRGRDTAGADLAEIGALFPVLRERAHSPAGRLSGGEQQQLAIARAVVARPRLLILDEPTLGLAPLIIEKVYGIVQRLRSGGITIVLVDENAARAAAVADRLYVMRSGVVALGGASAELRGTARLEAAYFGFAREGAA